MNILEIRDLRKSYLSPDGERSLVLDIPELALEEGQAVALQGASGSGKTTLLHIIAGILQTDGGQVLVAGQDMAVLPEPQRDRLRGRSLGYVFQTFNLLHGYSALENVALAMMFGAGVDFTQARRLLERVGLAARMDHLPRQLSTGQQQRVAVARALANSPRLVLADEPTGNLDARHAAEVLSLIREVCAECGAALLLVSHAPEVLGCFEKVLELAEINRAARTGEVGS